MIFAATALAEIDALLDEDDGASLEAGSLAALCAAAGAGEVREAVREAVAAVTGRTVAAAEERMEEEASAIVFG